MKNSLIIAGSLLIAFILTGATARTMKSTTVANQPVGDSSSIPSEISNLLDNSCLACHGPSGRPMATSVLNLSEWDGYSSAKKAQKAAAICKEVTDGAMPPAGYLKNNPGAALTKVQVDSICLWSTSIVPAK